MKVLHTADWHVGKVLKRQSRTDEHGRVLASLVDLARSEDVDAVVIPGDLFDSSAPGPEAQGLVMRALLALREDDRHVVVLAGNHDNLHLFDAVYRPVLGELGVHVLGYPKRADAGGTTRFTTRSGVDVTVAALPFVPHRFAVRAAESVLHETSQLTLDYARRMKAIVESLTEGFTPHSVNIVMTHATMLGGRRGGGERDFQTSFDYELPANLFPSSTHYAALGHLHRYQEIDGPCPIAYSGSPLAVDFGEEMNESVALIVTATPDSRASIRPVPIAGGRSLVTLRGTLDEVVAAGESMPDAWLRVVLAEPASAGLGDRVRDKLPNALEVQLDEEHRPRLNSRRDARPSNVGRSPSDLFADYLASENVEDPRLMKMFVDLLDAAGSPGEAGPDLTDFPVEPLEPEAVVAAAKPRRARKKAQPTASTSSEPAD
jgi:exonuclease SbcD